LQNTFGENAKLRCS